MFFIDESGSIPKSDDRRRKNRYFVIGFVHTDNPQKVKRVYQKAIGNLKKYFPDFFSSLKDPNELKGSDTPPFMKMYILEHLLQKTDVRFAQMVVDNQSIKDVFKKDPARTFNFLVKIIMQNFPLSNLDKNCLQLVIDNRNTSIPSLKSLEDYLFGELVLNDGLTKSVDVKYVQSDQVIGVQVADLFANTVYQSYRYDGLTFPNFSEISPDTDLLYPETSEILYRLVQPRVVTPFTYPPYNDVSRQVAVTSD